MKNFDRRELLKFLTILGLTQIDTIRQSKLLGVFLDNEFDNYRQIVIPKEILSQINNELRPDRSVFSLPFSKRIIIYPAVTWEKIETHLLENLHEHPWNHKTVLFFVKGAVEGKIEDGHFKLPKFLLHEVPLPKRPYMAWTKNHIDIWGIAA